MSQCNSSAFQDCLTSKIKLETRAVLTMCSPTLTAAEHTSLGTCDLDLWPHFLSTAIGCHGRHLYQFGVDSSSCFPLEHRHTHTHTTILLLFWNMSGTTRVSRYQKGKTKKVKTNLDLLEQEIVSGSGICWAICKSAPHPRQPRQHPTTQFFTGRMPFLPPNQQHQSTEGKLEHRHRDRQTHTHSHTHRKSQKQLISLPTAKLQTECVKMCTTIQWNIVLLMIEQCHTDLYPHVLYRIWHQYSINILSGKIMTGNTSTKHQVC